MKLYKLLITVLIIGASFTSCDYLDVVPDNVATLDNAFTDKYMAEKALFTCYSYLPNFVSTGDNPAILGGDEIWKPEFYAKWRSFLLPKGGQNINNPIHDFWRSNMFVGIRFCNIFLERIGEVRDLDDYQRKQWIAEVNFIKAYLHFYLVRMYGPIPISDKNIAVSEDGSVLKKKRNTLDECFNFIVETMDKAIADLDETLQNPTEELGRITKPIAMAMKARILVTAASPLFNGNPDYMSFEDNEGNKLFPQSYDPAKWEAAAIAAKEAIDICEKNGVELFTKDMYETPVRKPVILLDICRLYEVPFLKGGIKNLFGEVHELIWKYKVLRNLVYTNVKQIL